MTNPYGRFGSGYSPYSINNPYVQYGSPYSNNSPTNPYATNPPTLVNPNIDEVMRRLSQNPASDYSLYPYEEAMIERNLEG